MSKDEPIKLEGEVKELLPNTMFRVMIGEGHLILAHISGGCGFTSSSFCRETRCCWRCPPTI